MIFCIDIGNTSIKMACVRNRRLYHHVVVPSGAGRIELSAALKRASNGAALAALSSVRPRTTTAVRAMLRRDLGVEPLIVSSRVKLPLEIATRHPARVGVDRICAACGALPGSARNAIIVDAGSAITVDLVMDRRFLGGLIMPGPQMALSALHHFTAQLPDLTLDSARGDTFDDTAPAMRTGAIVGSAGAIQAAVDLLKKRGGNRRLPVWLTGGHAARLEGRLTSGWKLMPGLTLLGLAAIAEGNRPR